MRSKYMVYPLSYFHLCKSAISAKILLFCLNDGEGELLLDNATYNKSCSTKNISDQKKEWFRAKHPWLTLHNLRF